jgi:hypothetical protein
LARLRSGFIAAATAPLIIAFRSRSRISRQTSTIESAAPLGLHAPGLMITSASLKRLPWGVLNFSSDSKRLVKPTNFGGIQVYSLKMLLELLLTALNRQRVLIPIPFALAEMQAGLLELLPNPPLIRDQVRPLKTHKVVGGVEPTLGDLGVQPRPLERFLAVFSDKYA